MKFRENERKALDLKAKAIILLSIFISFFAIMTPVWQKGAMRQKRYEIILAEKKLESLKEEEKSLMAYMLENTNNREESKENLKAGI